MAQGGRRGLTDFARLLGELRRNEPWGRKLSRHRVFQVWAAAVGGALARVARPVAVRGRRLSVEVSGSAWLQELKLRERELLERINAALGEEAFTGLLFRLGEWRPEAGEPQEERPGPVPSRIATEDEPAIKAALEGLGDPDLRETAERLLRRARRRGGAPERPMKAADRGKEE
ncbi:MAG: DUF721 domain-containing protein [Nitrospinota bacterium]